MLNLPVRKKAYELVPEAYHQKFRNYNKQESQAHVEFACQKEVYFDRWCNSREVGIDFEKFILIKEFKRCVHDDIKTYLDEQKYEHTSWYQKHTIKNLEIIINKKVKLMLNLPVRKKAYELVPEAYHQKFRNYNKQESQAHVEFACQKEVYFDRWCNSREVGIDFEKFILIKEFKRCVHDDIKTYLDEQKFENLAKAAAYADDYALTHKSTFNKNRCFGPTKKCYPEVGKKSENVAPEKGQTSNQTMSMDRKPRSFAPVCHYCKKPGHVMSDCWLLKKRREKEAKPNAFVSSISNWRSNPNRTESSIV